VGQKSVRLRSPEGTQKQPAVHEEKLSGFDKTEADSACVASEVAASALDGRVLFAVFAGSSEAGVADCCSISDAV
jgi:hypothetical protein